MMNGVYNLNQNLEKALINLNSKPISRKNKQLIEDFISFLAANGVGKSRQIKYVYGLQNIAEWLKIDFDKAVKQDIQRICGIIENKDDFTDWTKHDHKIFIKKFYIWFHFQQLLKKKKRDSFIEEGKNGLNPTLILKKIEELVV